MLPATTYVMDHDLKYPHSEPDSASQFEYCNSPWDPHCRKVGVIDQALLRSASCLCRNVCEALMDPMVSGDGVVNALMNPKPMMAGV